MDCMQHDTAVRLTETVRQRIRETLTPGRYEHSMRVAELCRELCVRFSLDPDVGYFAGVAHDMCKEFSKTELMRLALEDGHDIIDIEHEKPALLHGRAAAMILLDEYGVPEGAVTNAVRHHTFGDPRLEPLALALYVADKIEPGRDGLPDGFRERVMSCDLPTMSELVLEETLRHLASKKKKISGETFEMHDRLIEEV